MTAENQANENRLSASPFERRKTRRELLKEGAAGAGALLLSGGAAGLVARRADAASSPAVSAVGKPGGVLRYGNSAFPVNFDPFVGAGEATFNATMAVHRGLLSYDEHGKYQAELAETWHHDGPAAYRFHLRKNARFHDGSPVTADDVQASFQRMLDPKSGAQRYGQYSQIIRSVDVIDPMTVRIALTAPNATFLKLLATCGSPVVSNASLQASPTNPTTWAGAGPFMYGSIEQGTYVQLVKNPHYYRPGIPKLDGIKIIAYPDDNLRVAALEAGDVDIIDFVPYSSMRQLQRSKSITLESNHHAQGMELQFNVTKPPFNNPLVRRAIGYAIDRKEIVQSAFYGFAEPLSGVPIPPDSLYYNRKLASFYSYDPQKAKSLLAQAGYPQGFSATLLANTTYGFHKDTAVVVQQELSKIGLDVQLALPDWPTRVSLNLKGQFDMAVEGIGINFNDPDSLVPLTVGKNTILGSYGFNDPQLNFLLNSGRATLDQRKRKPIYDRLQRRFLEDTPVLPLVWRDQAFAYRKSVRGFRELPGALWQASVYSLDTTTVR